MTNYYIIFLVSLLLLLFLFRQKMQSAFRRIGMFLPINFLRIFFFKIGGTRIGKNVKINLLTRISKNVIIDDGAVIGYNSNIGEGTIVGKGTKIEDDCSLYMTEVGENTTIRKGTISFGNRSKGRVSIGSNCSVGYYTILDGTGGLNIGINNHISSHVTFWTHSSLKNALRNISPQSSASKKDLLIGSINTEDNVWIGKGATLFPGVKVGHNSAILPHSLIEKDVKPLNIIKSEVDISSMGVPKSWSKKK